MERLRAFSTFIGESKTPRCLPFLLTSASMLLAGFSSQFAVGFLLFPLCYYLFSVCTLGVDFIVAISRLRPLWLAHFILVCACVCACVCVLTYKKVLWDKFERNTGVGAASGVCIIL